MHYLLTAGAVVLSVAQLSAAQDTSIVVTVTSSTEGAPGTTLSDNIIYTPGGTLSQASTSILTGSDGSSSTIVVVTSTGDGVGLPSTRMPIPVTSTTVDGSMTIVVATPTGTDVTTSGSSTSSGSSGSTRTSSSSAAAATTSNAAAKHQAGSLVGVVALGVMAAAL